MEDPTIGGHEISPWALMLPPIKEGDYLRMKQETMTHGQAKPIYRYGGLILSGVTDLRICNDLEKEPWIVDLDDDVDPVRFLISEHFNQIDNRRNSRVVFAFRLSQDTGPGRPPSGRKEHRLTIDEAVKAVGASRKGVEQLRRISREGIAELFQEVLDYRIAITDAEGILGMSHDVQRQAVDLHRHGRAPTVTRAVWKLEQETREKEGAAAAEVRLASPLMETVTLLNSTVGGLHRRVDAESVDLILANPPAGKQHLGVFSELAAFADHALSQSGLMALLVRDEFLPQILELVSHSGLSWLHRFEYRIPHRPFKLPPPHRGWVHKQSLLIYGKPRAIIPEGEDYILESKRMGPTGYRQSDLLESGMKSIVKRFVHLGGTVCDPLLMGRAGIALGAREHGCRFIGASDNSKFIKQVKDRLESEEAKRRRMAEGKASGQEGQDEGTDGQQSAE